MEAAVAVGAQVLSACQDAHSKQAMTAAMYLGWASWADRLGQPKVWWGLGMEATALSLKNEGCECSDPATASIYSPQAAAHPMPGCVTFAHDSSTHCWDSN